MPIVSSFPFIFSSRFFSRELFLVLLLSLIPACGKHAGNSDSRRSDDLRPLSATNSVLLFSGTDVKFESSAIYALNLEKTDEWVTVLGGQSSDLIVKQSGGRVFAFNRQGGLSSYYELVIRKNDQGAVLFDVSEQFKLKDVAASDPHDVVLLDDTHLLLVSYVGGSLAVLNLADHSLSFQKHLNFGVAKDQPLRFESGVKMPDGTVALVRQGLSSTYEVDGTQAVYVLTWDGKTLDLAKDTPRVGLSTSIPVGLFSTPDASVFQTITVCSPTFAACKPGLDEVDLKNRKSSNLKSFSKLPFQFYGSTVHDAAKQTIYAAVIEGNGEKTIVSVDQKSGFVTNPVYTYPDGGFTGYWGLFFNAKTGDLLIGDARTERSGRLTVLHEGKTEAEVDLPAIPYSGEVIQVR